MPFTIHRIENAFITGTHNSSIYTNLPAGKYFISGNNCTIYFYINPLLAKSQVENIISIRKNKNLPLEFTLLESQITTKMDMLVYFRTLFPQILIDNIEFFDKLAVIKHHYNDSIVNFKNKKDLMDGILLLYQDASNSSSVPNNMEQNLQTLAHFFNEGNNEMLKTVQSTSALFYITWSSAFLSENDFRYLLAEFYTIKNN